MTEIVFGAGAIGRVTEFAAPRAFVVTDPGVVAAGHVAKLESILSAGDIGFARYDRVRENPTERDVGECFAAYRAAFPNGRETIVGLGGGSAIDVAKGCATLASQGGRMRDYLGRGPTRFEAPLVVAIPTTAGTGSEVQSYALVSNDDTGQKMACGGMAPVTAILDPELTVTMPPFVTACTGLDTLAHAVETAVTSVASPESRALSREAYELVDRNLERVFDDPGDLEARGAMLEASAKAGLAIERSMLGAAHSMANPLTVHFGIPHGQAVGLTLPHVVRFNAVDPGAAAAYAELADSADALAARLEELIAASGIGGGLADVPISAIDTLAAEAAEQWTAQFNPRAVDVAAFRELYRAAVQ